MCFPGVAVQADDPSDGIRSVKQGGRSFGHFDAVDGKLVYFQTVVIAPLLPFVFDAVLCYNHAVEAQAAYRRLRLPGADAHRLYAGDAAERLHETACEVVLKKLPVNADGIDGRTHLKVFLPVAQYGYVLHDDAAVDIIPFQLGNCC